MTVRYFSYAVLILGLFLTAGCGVSSKEVSHSGQSNLKFSFSSLLPELKAKGLVTGRFLKVSSVVRIKGAAPRGLRKAADAILETPYEHNYIWDELSPITFIEYPVEGSGTVSITFEILDENSASVASLQTSGEFEISEINKVQEIALLSVGTQTVPSESPPPSAPLTDDDGDGVLDFIDECPSEGSGGAGVDGAGCPLNDYDRDGVADRSDECADTGFWGMVDEVGCPLPRLDADGDGIEDAFDQCPNEPGVEKFRGCPEDRGLSDIDMDGVYDHADDCPTQGKVGFLDVDLKGCPYPDADADGRADYKDWCPSQGDKGYGVDEDGCPYLDSDGDGVIDLIDRCDGEGDTGYGVDVTGCPYPPPSALDSDGDGILDGNDACPFEDGKGSTNGCPPINSSPPVAVDTDGDGLPDASDSCPNLGGIIDAIGCPIPNALDSDGDGVLDSNDQCPGTTGQPGYYINEVGCYMSFPLGPGISE